MHTAEKLGLELLLHVCGLEQKLLNIDPEKWRRERLVETLDRIQSVGTAPVPSFWVVDAQRVDPILACLQEQNIVAEGLLNELEALFSEHHDLYSTGETANFADVLVFAELVEAARQGIDVNAFPRLSKFYEAFRQISYVQHVQAVTENTTVQALGYKEPDGRVAHYLDSVVNRPIGGLAEVRTETFEQFGPIATKISAIEVCRFLRWTAAQMQARRSLEVGVFTGSSSLALLEGMGPDGHLDAIDISADYTAIAQNAWRRAGAEHRVRLILDDGVRALNQLTDEPPYDLAYVDALNEHYCAYHEAIVPLMRAGGLIIFDNILWKGRVTDPKTTDPSALHLRELNQRLAEDQRLDATFISIGDGLALCRVL